MRKQRSKNGTRGQHRVGIAIDNEIWEWWKEQPNKTRLVNQLLQRRMEKQKQAELEFWNEAGDIIANPSEYNDRPQ